MAKSKTKATYEIEIPVTFGDASIGDGTFGVGFTIDRKKLMFTQAEKYFVGKRLSGTLVARAGEAQADQPSFEQADNDVTLTGSFDIKGIRIGPKKWSGKFTFNSESANAEALAHLVKRQGMALIEETEALPETKRGRPKKAESEDPEVDETEEEGEE